jgi:two-component system response regulator
MQKNPRNPPQLPRPVLYGEDVEDDAFFMQRAFDQAAVPNPLVVVSDGQEVIEYLFGSGRYRNRLEYPLPGLLLLDLNLPKKTGIEVLKWIRNDPAVATLPVIVLTSSVLDADIHRAYVEGANAYLVKPTALKELIRMVKNIRDFWLSQNRTARNSWDAFGIEGR